MRGHSISPRFRLFAFVFGITVIKKIRKEGESKIPLLYPTGGKFLLGSSARYD